MRCQEDRLSVPLELPRLWLDIVALSEGPRIEGSSSALPSLSGLPVWWLNIARRLSWPRRNLPIEWEPATPQSRGLRVVNIRPTLKPWFALRMLLISD